MRETLSFRDWALLDVLFRMSCHQSIHGFATTLGIWEQAKKGTAAPQSHWPPAMMLQWLVTPTEQPHRHPGCHRSELGEERQRETHQQGTQLCRSWMGWWKGSFCSLLVWCPGKIWPSEGREKFMWLLESCWCLQRTCILLCQPP